MAPCTEAGGSAAGRIGNARPACGVHCANPRPYRARVVGPGSVPSIHRRRFRHIAVETLPDVRAIGRCRCLHSQPQAHGGQACSDRSDRRKANFNILHEPRLQRRGSVQPFVPSPIWRKSERGAQCRWGEALAASEHRNGDRAKRPYVARPWWLGGSVGHRSYHGCQNRIAASVTSRTRQAVSSRSRRISLLCGDNAPGHPVRSRWPPRGRAAVHPVRIRASAGLAALPPRPRR